jgi:hypothetical protein
VKTKLASRFWVEAAMAVASALAVVLFAVREDWIEAVFGVDPDRHSGSAEALLVVLCVAVTLTFSALARHEWRRAQAAAQNE